METDSALPGSALLLPTLAGLPGLRLLPCTSSGPGPAPGTQRREMPWLERARRAPGTHTLQCPARCGVVFSLWCHRGGALFQKSPLLGATGSRLHLVSSLWLFSHFPVGKGEMLARKSRTRCLDVAASAIAWSSWGCCESFGAVLAHASFAESPWCWVAPDFFN